MQVIEEDIFSIQVFNKLHFLCLIIFIIVLCFFIFFKSDKIIVLYRYILIGSLFLYILNPSIIIQYIFTDYSCSRFFNSILNLIVMYINFYSSVFLFIDIKNIKSRLSFIYIIFLLSSIYQLINIDMILYNKTSKNQWLNYLSMISYMIFISFLSAGIIFRWISFFRNKNKLEFFTIIELIFITLIGFPTIVFNKTPLIYSSYGIIDFYGHNPYRTETIFDVVYWLAILYYIIFLIVFLLYFFKFCKHKESFILKCVITLLITSYIRRATMFFNLNFGLMILLDSPCAFFLAAYLLYLKFKKKTFAYYIAYFILPVSILFNLMYQSVNGTPNIFTYFTLDSFLFHVYLTPLSLTIFSFDKFDKIKYIFSNFVMIFIIKIFYGILGNIAGYIYYKFQYNLNIYEFNGFLFRYYIFEFFEPIFTVGIYANYGIIISPLMYIVMPIICLIISLICFYIVRIFKKIYIIINSSKKCKISY